VPDKGLDRIFTFRIDGENKKLIQSGNSIEAREGAGPRHIAFHPNGRLAYVINELDSTVTAYHFDPANGALEPFQFVSALPDFFTPNSRASEIAISANGHFLYASNRGYDSIAMFAVILCHRSDRALYFHPNEESDSIVTCRVDQSNGKLAMAEGRVGIGSPVCIVFTALF
jgi:6-phosphogluconolactonase (cycloisomerase 2 family)